VSIGSSNSAPAIAAAGYMDHRYMIAVKTKIAEEILL